MKPGTPGQTGDTQPWVWWWDSLSFKYTVLIFAVYVQILKGFSNRLVCTAIAALCLPSLAPITYHHNSTASRHIFGLKKLVECKCHAPHHHIASLVKSRGFTHLAALGLVSMILRCMIVKSVELVDLIEMCKTDCFGETRFVLHVPGSS